MLGIKDKYKAFCLDEAALYIYRKLCTPEQKDGNGILKNLSKRK